MEESSDFERDENRIIIDNGELCDKWDGFSNDTLALLMFPLYLMVIWLYYGN